MDGFSEIKLQTMSGKCDAERSNVLYVILTAYVLFDEG